MTADTLELPEPSAWAEIDEDQTGRPYWKALHLKPTDIVGEHRRAPLYSADQMRAFGELVREECAKVCEAEAVRLEGGYTSVHDDRCIGARECASAIRNRMHCVRCGDTGFAEDAPDKPLVKCPDCSTPSSAIRNKE